MLTHEDRGQVRWLTIGRPARRNAIPPDGWARLRVAFEDFEASDQRVLVVRGEGGDFSAGADLADDSRAEATGAAGRYAGLREIHRAVMALHGTTKPTIALVDGVAVGAGMNMALGCDLVVATPRSRFSEIFTQRGLTVDFGGTWILPRVVGLQRAKELAFSGRIVGGAEARDLGLVLDLVEPDQIETYVSEMAAMIASRSPLGQMFSKQGLNASFESSLAEALDREGQAQAICLNSKDAVEGVAAFLEKRPPEFEGR